MSFRSPVRVRYPETDAMGVAHHTNFFIWFEIGRTELLRDGGFSYADLEKEQIFLPVVEATCRYLHPAQYDELLWVETEVAGVGAVKIRFSYRITCQEDGRLIATGNTLHASLNGRRKPTRIPVRIRDLLLK